ncbi:PE family protein [Mycobacterium sp. TY814]|uniref:PE family protein n=1 Tax=unclassified Mycobacterium TaxID=2642494 RepID=UPI0027424A08|nr:PE family protein [Mycobacterium sp. TY814]MDP7725853.1 PE family protein [Mycobacterium sp. TY814]
MSFVSARPELLEAASADLADIGATLSATNAFVAAPTTAVPPPGSDGVSAAISAMFGWHGQAYQQLSAQAGAFHDQFVQLLRAGAQSYSTVDAANQAALQAETVASAGATGPVAAEAQITPVVARTAATETPLYAALANSPAFEGLGDWLQAF